MHRIPPAVYRFRQLPALRPRRRSLLRLCLVAFTPLVEFPAKRRIAVEISEIGDTSPRTLAVAGKEVLAS
jgi:hypothetical protein